MPKRLSPLLQDVDGGHSAPSGPLTVKALRAILAKYPDDMTVMLRYPSKDFSVETSTSLDWAGKGHLLFSEADDPRYGLYLQPLAPSRVVANRRYHQELPPKPRT